MSRCLAVLFLFLFLAGSASAATADLKSSGALKVSINPSPDSPVMENVSVPRIPIVVDAGRGTLEVYSVPSGASVNLSGRATNHGTTPVKYSLPAGNYTVAVSLPGYRSSIETFSLAGGAVKSIDVDLQKIVISQISLTQQEIKTGLEKGGSGPGPAVTFTLSPDAVTRVKTFPALPVTTTPSTWHCPSADWNCLTEAEAAQQFGYPNARYGSNPCGYIQADQRYVYKYCFMNAGSDGSLPPAVIAAGSVKDGDDIYILNETLIQHGVVNRTAAQVAAGSASPLEAVFGFFNSILGGSKKPDSRLDIVGFAPCPEPPKVALGTDNNPENSLDLVSLNPCPEPPAQDPQVALVK